MTPPSGRPTYIGSEIYRRSTYGPTHPLAIPRVTTCTDLCRAMGWLPDEQFVVAPMAERADVERFHDPAYVDALFRAEANQSVSDEDRARFRIGAEGNPVYPEIYRRPMTSAGGVMLACRTTLPGGVVHCPGGGTHHGRPARARNRHTSTASMTARCCSRPATWRSRPSPTSCPSASLTSLNRLRSSRRTAAWCPGRPSVLSSPSRGGTCANSNLAIRRLATGYNCPARRQSRAMSQCRTR